MQPEILAYDGGLSTMGVFGHEFGHLLGLPDLYDTNFSNGASEGIGWWGMMGTGNWNKISRKGDSPSHFSAWSKWFLGWITPTHVTAFLTNESIDHVEFNDDVYQLLSNPGGPTDWTSGGAGSGEYFLVENRQNISSGFDAGLPGGGLLIWHIDESQGNNANESHYLVALEQADGLFHLENMNNRGDAGDPWASNATGFTEATTPNTTLYNGSLSGVRITDISASAAVMTADLFANWPTLVIFVAPTPQNNFNLSRNYVFVNATARESLSTALLEWAGTNETMNSASSVSWFKNKTGLADGSYTYRVWGNNSTGDWGVSETRVVTIDTTPPIVTITSPSGATNDTAPELNFTIDEPAHAIYSWDSEGNISGCRMCTSYNTTYGESVPDANTSILLHFNENFDDMAFDDSTNGNDGTLGNATPTTHPDWITGRFGYALDFDGNDFVKVADDDSIDFDNDSNYSFTLMFWVKTGDSAFSGTQYVFDKSSGSDSSYNGYHMFISSTDSYKLRFMYHQAETVDILDVSSTGPIYDGEWHHIAAVRNVTADMGYLYIDGILNSSADDNSTGPEDNSGDLNIGARGPAWNNFNGTIDDFHIIARALSPTEIGDIYNKTLPEGSHTVTVYANDTASNLNSTTSSFTVGASPLEITIDSPANGTAPDTTPDLSFTINAPANTTYSWDGEGNISGCRNCDSYNTTYGEYANSSEQNLTALWHLNENFSTTAYDDSANGNDATLGNATAGTKPTWTTGRFGYGLKFDGFYNFVNISYDASLDVLDGDKPFTFATWFKLDEVGSTNTLFSQANGAGTGRTWLIVTAGNNVKTWLGGSQLTSNSVLAQDQWYFVVLNYNGSLLEMYIDGTFDTSTTTTVDQNADGEYYMGRSKSGTAWFNGTIDEIMLFDRNLSAAEIQNLYNEALPVGQHSVTVYAVDNASNSNSETRWFTTVLSVDINSPLNTTIFDTTPDLNFTVNLPANTTYNWNSEGNISGCRNCDSFNTTYGEYANSSEQNLTALYHFNENTGTTLFDETANDNDGVITGAAYQSGKFGHGLKFDGNGDFVNISYDSTLDVLDNNDSFTFAAWFKLDALPSAGTAAIYSQNAGTGKGRLWLFVASTNDRIYTGLAGGGKDTGITAVTDTWYFAVIRYNGTDLQVYIDDILKIDVVATADEEADGEYYIGSNNVGGAGWFNGTIDEIILFDRNLSVAEIQNLYNKTLSATQHSVTVYATDVEDNQDSATRYFTVG